MKSLSINPQILKNAYLNAFNKHKKLTETNFYPNFPSDYQESLGIMVELELLIEKLTDLTVDEFLEIY